LVFTRKQNLSSLLAYCHRPRATLQCPYRPICGSPSTQYSMLCLWRSHTRNFNHHLTVPILSPCSLHLNPDKVTRQPTHFAPTSNIVYTIATLMLLSRMAPKLYLWTTFAHHFTRPRLEMSLATCSESNSTKMISPSCARSQPLNSPSVSTSPTP
jgi:hypothetical protein